MVGHHVNGTWVRFAQRSEHHDSKQPVLVTYTQDNITRPTYIEPSESGRYLIWQAGIINSTR